MSRLIPITKLRYRSGTSAPMNLTRQFALTGSVIMIMAMIVAGLYIVRVTSKTTVENTASATALLTQSFISPLAQTLANTELLSDDNRGKLDELLGSNTLKERFPYLEIWKAGGLVVYSTTPTLIGRRFVPPDGLLTALEGRISAQYTDLGAREHLDRGLSNRYLEIYIPIREHLSGRVIAVAEIHENTADLKQELWWLHLKSWLAVSGATSLIMLGLFAIVYRGNQLILTQHDQLRERLFEIQQTSHYNRVLKERVQRASSRVTEVTENYLRRIGADLHDGPSQLIGLAALTVEHIRRADTPGKREEELQRLDTFLSDALRDIRATSRGLMLPEIQDSSLPEIIRRVVATHERRTTTKVDVHCDGALPPLTYAIKICAYRFVQECLNNAFRHANGNGQTVRCIFDDPVLNLIVEDNGADRSGSSTHPDSGLGLVGLRDRVESLGGTIRITQRPNGGTRVEMSVVTVGEGENV
jgi:signal transduction histidine kinase